MSLYKLNLLCGGFNLKLETYPMWQYIKITVYKRKYKNILVLKFFVKQGGLLKR